MQLFRTKSVEQTIAETGEEGRKLKRNLTWWDLSIMGVAVAVGAGIFSVGAQAAAFHAGPAVIISFLIAGIVCGRSRDVLRRIRFDDSGGRLRLHLHLHHGRRDPWPGSSAGI